MIKARSGEYWVIRFQDGENLLEGLKGLGLKSAAILGAVGMLRDLAFGYWDGERYVEEPVPEPVELLSLSGNIGEADGEVVVHAHVVAGMRDGNAIGGHLLRATVHNTTEMVLLQLSRVRLARKPDPSGLLGLYPEER